MAILDNKTPKNLPKVLLINQIPLYNRFEPEFSKHFDFIKAYESTQPLHHFLAATDTAGVTAMLIGGFLPITAKDILEHLPSLRCIATITAGLNHIDLKESQRRGIVVTSAGDAYSDDCSDFAVALLMDLLRKVSLGDRFIRGGGWSGEGQFRLGHRVVHTLQTMLIILLLEICP